MATQTDVNLRPLRDQLELRRQKLQEAVSKSQTAQAIQLLHEVDKALERIELGSYGLCETCHDPIEAERLFADPLVRFCLDHLLPAQKRALEDDLVLAAQIQAGLLPKQDFALGGWRVFYHYEAAGPVSGDYCDLVANNGDLYFMLGDVSGKGVAASMLMANLHAMFRVLIPAGLPLEQLVERASRVFCESTLPTQFATLVCGRAAPAGQVEICNAGQVPPLIIRPNEISGIETTSLPIGIFSDAQYSSTTLELGPGDSLVIYTDGVSETQNDGGDQFGEQQLRKLMHECRSASPKALVESCIRRLNAFQAGNQRLDDRTIMAIQFAPPAAS